MEQASTIIVIIGITQGLFIGSSLLLDKFYASTANKYIGLTLILLSIQGILDVLSFWNVGEGNRWMKALLSFGLQGLILIPYFLSVTRNLKIKLPIPVWSLFIPFGLSFIHGLISAIIIVTGHETELWDRLYIDKLWSVHWYLNIVFVIALHAYTYRLIRQASTDNNKKGAQTLWIAFSLIIVLWVVFILLGHWYSSKAYYLMTFGIFWGLITLFIFWFTYNGIVKQRLINEQKSLHLILDEKRKVTTSQPRPPKFNKYYDQFIHLLEEEKIYLDSTLNRDEVAKKLGISSGYFSQVLSESSAQSFNHVISEYRVNEVKKILSDGSLNHFSLTAIGLEVGFKSKSTFFSTFKKLTGYSPSSYKDQMQS